MRPYPAKRISTCPDCLEPIDIGQLVVPIRDGFEIGHVSCIDRTDRRHLKRSIKRPRAPLCARCNLYHRGECW